MTETDYKIAWPGWETVRLIGRGSFGAVYEIERDVFGHKEKAALKVITIPQSDSDIEELYDSGYDEASVTETFKSHLEGIVNEYSLMREMNGAANVVNCDDFRIVAHDDNIGWEIFIKMELLTPLTKALDRQPSDAQVIQIAKDMCRALILCKKYGIIHRDIKPQNIFVSKNGDYKLGDFGIAKTIEKTSGGTKIGTYKYMAPEVYNNQPYNLTADIYSLGLVLHWLLNERRSPFMPLPPAPAVATQEDEARAKRFNGIPIPAPAHGSEGLKRIVLKACAFDPKDRYQSAEEMLRALETIDNAVKKYEPVASSAYPPEENENMTVSIVPASSSPDEEATVSSPLVTAQAVEDATVSAFHTDFPQARDNDEATVSAFPVKESNGGKDDKNSDIGSSAQTAHTTPKKKKRIVPILAAIAAVSVIAVVVLQRYEQSVSPEPETSIVTDDPSHLSEAQLREIPDWYYDDSVTIKGNQLCFSRSDSMTIDESSIEFVRVYSYDAQGQLYDMREFDFFPTTEAAEKRYEDSINYTYSTGKNIHGYTKDDDPATYICVDSVLITVYGERYIEEYLLPTIDEAADYWAKLGWPVNRIDQSTNTLSETLIQICYNGDERTEFVIFPGEIVPMHAFIQPTTITEKVKWSCDDPNEEYIRLIVDPDDGNKVQIECLKYCEHSLNFYAEVNGVIATCTINFGKYEPVTGSVQVTPSPDETADWSPIIIKHATNETVEEGGTVRFVATAEYYETVEWYITNQDQTITLKADDLSNYFPGVSVDGADDCTLVIKNVVQAMSGWKVQAKFIGKNGWSNETNFASITIV